MKSKKRGLGKGLDALLSTSQAATKNLAEQQELVQDGEELKMIAIELLQPGKYQPRKDMSSEGLEELAESIQTQGVIQPIIVRQSAEDAKGYEIIAGERRWRASKLAKLTEVPCIIRKVSDESAVVIALIENIQREDLNAMEEAIALDRLIKEFELTHQQIADAVGKSRTTVSNLLRLNNLNEPVKRMLEYGDIDMGHARALLVVEGEQQTVLAKLVSAKELTVRETERLVNQTLKPHKKTNKSSKNQVVIHLEGQLTDKLGTKVSIDHNKKGKGKLVINYQSLVELDGIIDKIG